MKRLFLALFWLATSSHADTIDHYMNIANNIPQMEMKADAQSQTWAHSARTVLTLTCDGIMDALILANDTAKQQGHPPLFCITATNLLDEEKLNNLIQETYRSLTNPQIEKDRMTVSQIALIAIQKQYPCSNAPETAANTVQRPLWENH